MGSCPGGRGGNGHSAYLRLSSGQEGAEDQSH